MPKQEYKEYNNILLSSSGNISRIIINRPKKHNALDIDTLNGLKEALAEVSSDENAKILIISGSEDKAFCAGVDVDYLSTFKDEADILHFSNLIHNIFDSIMKMEKPVIAEIRGYCLGGGCELAMSCDIRIASSDAKFGQPEVKLGIIPGAGGTRLLPQIVGSSNAKMLIFTGDMISAEEALRIGLLNIVTDAQSLERETIAIAEKILENSYNAVKKAKKAMASKYDYDHSAEENGFIECFTHRDKNEGFLAFAEKRKPRFE
jgi:enoyl-CoA hydratase